MRGFGIAVIAAVLLVIVLLASYLVKQHFESTAKQQAREKLIRDLPVEWEKQQKNMPYVGVEGSMSVDYPNVMLDMTALDMPNNVILDSRQTDMLDRLMNKEMCDSLLREDDPKNEETRLAYVMMKEDRISITARFKNAEGYQVYNKRFYVTECPRFDELYKVYADQ